MAIEHVKHWKIGDVEVVRIVEVNAHEDPMSFLVPDATPEFVQQYKWLVPNFCKADGTMLISFQAFALKSQGKRVMIDTCIGADRQREFEIFCNMQTTFLEDLAASGYTPQNVNAVLCTHLHFDHVGWNTRLVNGKWVPTFPNARYLFGRKEWEHWQHLRATHGYHNLDHLTDSIDPIFEAGLVDLIEPEYRITDEVSLFPTPGHTPGHVSVRIKSNGKEAVITGDMMHHPFQFCVPDKPARFDMQQEVGIATRRRFYEECSNRDILVIGSHFCDPTSGYVVPDGNAWKLKTE